MPKVSLNSRGAVVVTGSSTGIGEACALHLDALGFQVFAGVRRGEDGVALRKKSSGRLIPILIDVTDSTSISTASDTIAAVVKDAGLAALINNAGIAIPGPLEILPIEEFRKQLEVNVIGQLAVTQAFLPMLRKSRGRIVLMSSISGLFATPFIGAYAASKFALEAMADALRVELIPWGIQVSVIEPGSIATPVWEKSRKHSGEIAHQIPPEARELYRSAYNVLRDAAQRAAS